MAAKLLLVMEDKGAFGAGFLPDPTVISEQNIDRQKRVVGMAFLQTNKNHQKVSCK